MTAVLLIALAIAAGCAGIVYLLAFGGSRHSDSDPPSGGAY